MKVLLALSNNDAVSDYIIHCIYAYDDTRRTRTLFKITLKRVDLFPYYVATI